MPVSIKKNKKGGYTVSTPGGVKAKNTSLSKAKKQEAVINMREHGIGPKGSSRKSKRFNRNPH